MIEHDGLVVRLHVLENRVNVPAEPFGFVVCTLPPCCRVYGFDRDGGARGEAEGVIGLWRGPGDVGPAAQLTGYLYGVGEVEISDPGNAQVRAYLDLRLANVVVLQAGHVADDPYGVSGYKCN